MNPNAKAKPQDKSLEQFLERKRETILWLLRLKKQPLYWTLLQAMNPNAKPQ